MRIALLQINPTVGDLAGNARLILEALEAARASGAAYRSRRRNSFTRETGT